MPRQTLHQFGSAPENISPELGWLLLWVGRPELRPSVEILLEAARIVGEVLTEVQRMEPGHWRDKFLEEVTRHFGHLLGQKKADSSGGDR